GGDLDLHPERDPGAGRLHRDVHGDEPRRRARAPHQGRERQPPGAPRSDRARHRALRHARGASLPVPRVLRHRAPHDVGSRDRGAALVSAVQTVPSAASRGEDVRESVDLRPEARLTSAYLVVALVALFGGVVTGLLQALEHAGIDLYPAVAPLIKSYYHGLSIHGVLNVL